jgi:hypothetical protein
MTEECVHGQDLLHGSACMMGELPQHGVHTCGAAPAAMMFRLIHTTMLQAGSRQQQAAASRQQHLRHHVEASTQRVKYLALMSTHRVNQVEHPSRRTCRDTLPPNARLLLLARLRMHRVWHTRVHLSPAWPPCVCLPSTHCLPGISGATYTAGCLPSWSNACRLSAAVAARRPSWSVCVVQ